MRMPRHFPALQTDTAAAIAAARLLLLNQMVFNMAYPPASN